MQILSESDEADLGQNAQAWMFGPRRAQSIQKRARKNRQDPDRLLGPDGKKRAKEGGKRGLNLSTNQVKPGHRGPIKLRTQSHQLVKKLRSESLISLAVCECVCAHSR